MNDNGSGLGRWMLPALIACIIMAGVLPTGCGDETNPREVTSEEENLEIERGVEAFGTVRALVTRNVILDFPCSVRKILVTEGEIVDINQKLIALDLSTFRRQVRSSELALAREKLRLRQLEKKNEEAGAQLHKDYLTLSNSIDAVGNDLLQLKNDLEQKQRYRRADNDPDILKLLSSIAETAKEVETAEKDLAHQQALYDDGHISDKQLDEYKSALDRARANLKSFTFSLESLRLSKSSDIARLEQQVRQRTNDLANLRLERDILITPEITDIEIQKNHVENLEEEYGQTLTRLANPWLLEDYIVSDRKSCVVTGIDCAEGDVWAGGKKLLTLVDLESTVVEANVPEEFIKDVAKDAVATVKPLADPDREYQGKVTLISSVAVNRNGETVVPIHIELDDRDSFLLPGFNVDVEIERVPDEPEVR